MPHTRRNKAGEVLYRRFVFVTILPDGTKQREHYQAKPGQGFTENYRERLILAWAKLLEQRYPDFDFNLVPISGGTQFQFVGKDKEAVA